jgi:hypothetical protein
MCGYLGETYLEKQSYWEINSKILIDRYPGLLDQLLREDQGLAAGDIKIETSASGEPALMVKGLYVHSRHDPAKEGKRLAQSAAGEKTSSSIMLIVLGFGLGYAAQELAELSPQSPIIIVEKYPALLRLAFELRNLEKLLSRNNIAFVLEAGGINRALSHFEKGANERLKTEILRNRPLTGLDEQWYCAVENRIRTWAMKDHVNSATLKKFGKRWVKNILRNAEAIRDLPGISRFAGLGANDKDEPLPVFMAAAGPGLDKVSSLLPEIRKRCIIVAVDTSLRFLSRNGVEPDFALVIDPQFWNSRHLDRCVMHNTRLIIESAVYPVVLRLPFKGMYLCGSLFPLGKFIEERVDPKGALATGGSVATSAWDFCRLLGARQIWIAGLDLAFPGNKTHYRGAQFEEKALAESCRLRPPESWLARALRDGIPCIGPALGGGKAPTDHRLSLYASWFENCFSQFPEIKNFSLSDGGLAIAGLEAAVPEALLGLPDRRKEIDARLEAACSGIEAEFFEPQEAKRRSQRYENAVAILRSALEQIKSACERGEEIASRALRQNPGPAGQEKTLASLDTINRLINSSEVKEIAGFLFPAQALEETGPGGLSEKKDAYRDYLSSLVKLYRSLAEAAAIEKLGMRSEELGIIS